MPTQLQLRRGTTVQHNTFTGVVGEVTINTSKKTAVVHDGSTAGGLELLRADMSNIFASATPTITSLNTSGDVSVGGNLTVTGTTTFNGGTITMGDADTDNVVFGADVNSNILPNTDNTYALGSSSKKWSDVRSVLLTTTGDATIGGDVAVNGGDLTTSQTTFNLLNTTATTLNVGGAATTLEIGAATGTTNINNNLDVDGDVNIDGGDLTVSTTTFNLANTTATTLNIGGAATSLNLGAATGTTTVGNNLTVTGDLTVSGNTTTLNTETLEVEDKNIIIAKVATPTDTTADGAGITIKGATDKTFNWVDATDAFTSSEHLALASGKNLYLNGSTSGTTTLTPSATASGTLTLPSATDTLVGKATTDTLTNKSISLTTNTITATSAELATAISDETGTGLLVFGTSPTLTTPVISSITNNGTLTLPTSTDTLIGRATTDTLTNKSVSLTTNTITGTLAEFNTALSDDNFVSLTGTETLTNKTLTTPVISSISNSGTITIPTGTDTLVGRATTDTLTNKTLTSPVISSITNTGTLTLPTSTDTLVGRATTDTLTNKTLTSPVISTITNTGTLTLPTSTDTLVGRATTDTLTNKTIGAATISGNLIPNANATIDLGSAANKFRHLYLDGSSFFMGTTKISMHNNGYFVFNSNSAGSYPEGSNVSVATATNGIAATNGTAAAFAIALGG
jgi:hypothetical protein